MIMENIVVWKNEAEISKVKSSYSTFVKAFNDAIDSLEKTFEITLRESEVKMFFENRKCLTPFVNALEDLLWSRGKVRPGISHDELLARIKKELSSFVRATLSIYWTSPDYVDITDCRLRVLNDKLDTYLLDQHSITLNTENRRKIWELATKGCNILNELEQVAAESSTNWFITHATIASSGGGSALISFDKGKYFIDGEQMANIK